MFDFELSAACARGLKQLPRLAAFDVLATNSRASAGRLRGAIGDAARQIHVLPPRILPCDAAALPDAAIVPRTAPELLYVGRIRSHKRIEDLLRLVAACRVRDRSVRLTLIGQADNAAAGHRLMQVVFLVELGLADTGMDNEPAAAARGPIPVLDVLAVVEDVMRIGLLDRQRLDLASFNPAGERLIIDHGRRSGEEIAERQASASATDEQTPRGE